MKLKLSVLLSILCLLSFQNADAQLFKRIKKKAKEKAKSIENKVINKVENKADKKINDVLEGKNDSKSKTTQSKNTKDVGDVIIKHSNNFGTVEITEATTVKVNKTNSGYTISGNWWSHDADIYDGFILNIKTDKNLKHDTEEAKNAGRQVFKIPEEASLKLGYDPQLPYYKKPEGDFKRAVTNDYQNYSISKGEVSVDVLSDETIQVSFSGKATLKRRMKKADDEYTKTYFEAEVTGGIDSNTPQFSTNASVAMTSESSRNTSTSVSTTQNTKGTNAVAGVYNFTHETVTKVTVPDQNRTYTMSYLLNPTAEYIAIKVNMNEYSDEEVNGESIIVMDKENVHIFVETAGMKMQMSNSMMGQQKMQNPTDQMANYDYSKLKKTGKTKTILGAECHEYTMADNTVKVNLWVAPNVNLPNWFVQNNAVLKGHIMEYSMESKDGNMKSETIEIKDNISKVINPKEYKKMF